MSDMTTRHINYNGKLITSAVTVERHGANAKITYGNGYVVIAPLSGMSDDLLEMLQ